MSKSPFSSIDLINKNIQFGKQLGISQLSTSDHSLTGRQLTTNGEQVLNFGSCSYLGLEMDERLKQGAIDAVNRYGSQFSCSRAYMSIGLYDELESLLDQIFGKPTIVAPSTTMGHLSTIPLLVGPNDAVILDHQVHASVQQAVRLAATNGAYVEMVRHNNMEALENRIQKLQTKHNKIWYMADGIYSMYGDCAPVKKLEELLNTYDQFHLYIDDAHGMAWEGPNGAGFVLDQIDFHPKMYLSLSLSKSFAAGGGVMIFPDQRSRELVRNCGNTLIFSGPLQPASLGAGIASAKILLSDEIYTMQDELKDRLQYFTETAKALNLPLIKDDLTPVFFLGASKTEITAMLCKELLSAGFYTNASSFPSVPNNNAGIRLTITRHLSKEDIKNFLTTFSEKLDMILNFNNFSRDGIFKAFKMNQPSREKVLV